MSSGHPSLGGAIQGLGLDSVFMTKFEAGEIQGPVPGDASH